MLWYLEAAGVWSAFFHVMFYGWTSIEKAITKTDYILDKYNDNDNYTLDKIIDVLCNIVCNVELVFLFVM